MRGVVSTGVCATSFAPPGFAPPGADPTYANMVRQASPLPSVNSLHRAPENELMMLRLGRTAVPAPLRACLSAHRAKLPVAVPATQIIDEAADQLAVRFA